MDFLEQTIEIDYFKDTDIDYKVVSLEIEEAISEVTNISCKIFFFEKSIWQINIPLNREIHIKIRENSNEEIYIKTYKCFIKEVKKEKSFNKDSLFFEEYLLEIICCHGLGKLSYSNNFYLWKHKTVGDVLKDLLLKHNLSLEGNTYGLHEFEKELIVQYGENDLHFFQRLLQSLGFFYVCIEDSNIIKVYNTPLGYEEINEKINIYNINKIRNEQINTIAYINEYNILSQEQFIHRDVNYSLPLPLEGISLEDTISYGKLYTYPSNSNNMKEISKSAIYKKNEFIKKKYTGMSYSFKFEPCKRIIIDDLKDNIPYVITYVKHVFNSNTLNNSKGKTYNYYNNFKTKNAKETFVSHKIFKKPLVSSMEVAIVKSEVDGEEVSFLDYEKVLIKFNWTKDDVMFYVWVPVAQYMAGKIFGSFIMPRVGDEVLIYFINGDPDKPIVYGGLHTKSTEKFVSNVEDKYKTILLRSHTFNEESILSYNEISVDDKLNEQKLFFKAQKDLNVEIGHKEQELEHHYDISLLGKGYKKEFIQDGNNTLEMLKGKKIQSIGGDYINNIKKTESGGDYFLTVEDGKLIIEVGGLGDIYFKGPCKIHSDSSMDISSIGAMRIHSDEKILMTAPMIEMVADDTIKGDAGVNISLKSVEGISSESALISSKALELISMEAGEMINAKAGIGVNIEAGLDLNIKSGLTTNIMSGLEMIIEGGLTTAISGGLEVSIEGGLSASLNGGLDVAIDGGLEAGINGGLVAEVAGGLTAAVDGGLSAEVTSGLVAAVLGAVAASLAGGGLVAMMI